MAERKTDLLQGTLDLLILKAVAAGPLHGWGIAKRIQSASQDVLKINQGSLYPALYRLQDQGLIRAKSGETDQGRLVKLYSLTSAGHGRFDEAKENWDLVTSAVDRVLQTI